MIRAVLLLLSSVWLLTACGGGEPVTEIGLDPVTPPISGSPTPPANPTPPATPPSTPPSSPPPPATPVTGNATLSWIPPTENEDGSPLTNLAGYRIFYGTSASNLSRQIDLNNPGLTRYVIDNLSGGTWYFGIRAYSSAGTQSALSAIASKTIG